MTEEDACIRMNNIVTNAQELIDSGYYSQEEIIDQIADYTED